MDEALFDVSLFLIWGSGGDAARAVDFRLGRQICNRKLASLAGFIINEKRDADPIPFKEIKSPGRM